MNRNIRWLVVGAALRACGLSLITPYFVLFVRNVLGIGYLEIGGLVVLVALPQLVVSSVGGLIADRIGRRILFLSSMVAEAVLILVVALAMHDRNLPFLLAAVSGAGIAGSLAGPAISAYTADFTTGSDRTRAFTWERVSWNVGFTLGVFVGGALVGTVGFVLSGTFGGTVLLGTTSLLVTQIDASPYDLARRPVPQPTTPPGSSVAPGSVRATLQSLARDRAFLVFSLGMGLAVLTAGQWGVTFPLFVNNVLGIPYVLLGVGLALNGLVVVFFQPPVTAWAIGRRHTSLAVIGLALYVAAFLFLAAFGELRIALLTAFFVSVFVLTIGENFQSIAGMTLPSNLAPPSEIGAYNGAYQTITGIGFTLAPFLGSLVLALTLNPLAIWSLLVLPAIPATALLLWVAPRIPERANRA